VAYGIVIKQEDNTYALAETGRKIFAPTYEGEKEEGIKKALFTPSVLSRFYTDYNGSPLPSDELFPNVLETRYQIPRERTAEAIEIMTKNAEFAGALLRTEDGKVLLRFSDTALPLSAKGQVLPTTSENADGHEQPQVESLPTPADVSSFENVCFVITPIGSEESNERKHADTVLRHLIEPIIKEMNLSAVRADLIAKPGIITKQIIEYVAHSPILRCRPFFQQPERILRARRSARFEIVDDSDHQKRRSNTLRCVSGPNNNYRHFRSLYHHGSIRRRTQRTERTHEQHAQRYGNAARQSHQSVPPRVEDFLAKSCPGEIGPNLRRLWLPAAATSTARLTCC
jgi:hypothetical protein